MVSGKLTPLEEMRFWGFIPILTCVLQAPWLHLFYGIPTANTAKKNDAECLSAQPCLGGEKFTHHCQELGSRGHNCH